MLITRPTIQAQKIRPPRGESRPADRLLFTEALPEGSKVPALPLVQSVEFPNKGKHKGLVLVKVEGKANPIPFERDAEVIVERVVADSQERADYKAAQRIYHKVDEAVRLRRKVDEAADAVISRAEEVRTKAFPYQPFGGAVFGRETGDLESYVGQYAMMLRCYGEALGEAGVTVERLQQWAQVGLHDDDLGHYVLRPSEPVNGDCGRDGLPVPREAGNGGWTCAPLDAPEPATV